MKRFCFAFCAACFCLGTVAQNESRSAEIRLVSDNDNYVLRLRDGYYTNGLLLSYDYIPGWFKKKVNSPYKKIISYYTAVQQIFTSESVTDLGPQIDRPLTANLYLQKGFSFFSQKGSVTDYSMLVGVTGKGAQGEQVQNAYHKLLSIDNDYAWSYQLNTGAAINASFSLYKPITRIKTGSPDIFTLLQARAGTLYSDIAAAGVIRIGKRNEAASSCFFNAAINYGPSPAAENFLYFIPKIQYQFFNATVQGGAFLNDKGPLLSGIMPFVFSLETGAFFSGKAWAFHMAATFQTREAKLMRHNVWFGSIGLTHRLKSRH